MDIDYYQKYIKYKTKYIELSNNNHIGGGRTNNSKPVFILFPGFASSKVWWNYKYENGKISKINFLNDLKKLGYTYTFTSKFFNLEYYYKNPKKIEKWEKIYKKYKPHTSDINFTLRDLDYDVICKKVHDDVRKKYKNNKLILIGHSYGSAVVWQFSKMYKKECLFAVILDGSPLCKKMQKQFFNKFEKKNENKIKKYLNTEIKLQNMLQAIKNKENSNKEINMIYDLISYHSTKWQIDNLNNKLYIPTIFIRAIHNNTIKYSKIWNQRSVDERKCIIDNNKPNMYDFKYQLNAQHFLWHNEIHSKDIINTIKCKYHFL